MLDKYVYPGTDVLINKLGIQDAKLLGDMEFLAYTEAINRGIAKGLFTLTHLQQIHKEIFGTIYEWAGQIRDVDISKGHSTFCRSDYIISESNKLLKDLVKENYLSNCSASEKFIDRFAHYYGEINVIHPFREGNGRATRIFFEQLASLNHYKLDLSNINKDRWRIASIESFNCDNTKLTDILRESLQPVRTISKEDIVKTNDNNNFSR